MKALAHGMNMTLQYTACVGCKPTQCHRTAPQMRARCTGCHFGTIQYCAWQHWYIAVLGEAEVNVFCLLCWSSLQRNLVGPSELSDEMPLCESRESRGVLQHHGPHNRLPHPLLLCIGEGLREETLNPTPLTLNHLSAGKFPTAPASRRAGGICRRWWTLSTSPSLQTETSSSTLTSTGYATKQVCGLGIDRNAARGCLVLAEAGWCTPGQKGIRGMQGVAALFALSRLTRAYCCSIWLLP